MTLDLVTGLISRFADESSVFASRRTDAFAVSDVDLGMQRKIEEDIPYLKIAYSDVCERKYLEAGLFEILEHGSCEPHFIASCSDIIAGIMCCLVYKRRAIVIGTPSSRRRPLRISVRIVLGVPEHLLDELLKSSIFGRASSHGIPSLSDLPTRTRERR